MAKQHLYARTEKGYFTKRPGFDTTALTQGLTENFVVKYIHPFCFYHKHNFKDNYNDILPPVYFCSEISAQDNYDKYNALIFGRNIYVHGIRNSMLSHSIIVQTEEEKNYAYKNFDSFIMFDKYIQGISEDEASNPKQIIPEQINPEQINLEEINLKDVNYDNLYFTSQVLFEALQITAEQYMYLLYNTFISLQNNTTMYIKLDCNRKLCSEGARLLLRCLYVNIPEKLRNKLYYVTYTPS